MVEPLPPQHPGQRHLRHDATSFTPSPAEVARDARSNRGFGTNALPDPAAMTAGRTSFGDAQNQDGGVLSVTDGTGSASLPFAGSFAACIFTLAADATGGTLIEHSRAARRFRPAVPLWAPSLRCALDGFRRLG